jgi:hypothetical protein
MSQVDKIKNYLLCMTWPLSRFQTNYFLKFISFLKRNYTHNWQRVYELI